MSLKQLISSEVFSFKRILRNQRGQSVLEFFFMLPVLVAVIVIMIKVNTAIQISINNQRYARAQTLFLAFNNPVYPELQYRVLPNNRFGELEADQFVLGVSDEIIKDEDLVKATEQSIVRFGSDNIGDNDPQKENVRARGRIRLRNTVTLCTQFNSIITENTRQSFCRRLYK